MFDRTLRLLDASSPAWKVTISILVTLIVGSTSGLITAGAVEGWYMEIQKPSFNPPNTIFGPVWTVLYVLMGFSAGLIWSNGMEFAPVRRALALFGVQLMLNVLWSLLFFGLKSPGLALIDIGLMLVAIGLGFYRWALFHMAAHAVLRRSRWWRPTRT